jgi:hypothetical protein
MWTEFVNGGGMPVNKTIAMIIAALGVAACDKNTTETRTTTETKQVGSTSESTTETTVDTPDGDSKSVTRSYAGTVTKYTPGESIEVMTGNKDTHSFNLDREGDVIAIDPRTTVGSKVQLVDETLGQGAHKIVVTIGPAA